MGVAVWDFSIWGLSGPGKRGSSLVGQSISVSVRRGTGKFFDLVGHIRQVRDTTLALAYAACLDMSFSWSELIRRLK